MDEKKLIIAPLNYMFRYLGDSWIARMRYKTNYICNKYLCKGKNIPQDVYLITKFIYEKTSIDRRDIQHQISH